MNELFQSGYLINNETLSIPLEDGIYFIGAIFFIVFYLGYRAGLLRYQIIQNTFQDPLLEKVNKCLTKSKQTQESSWPDFQKNKVSMLLEMQKLQMELQGKRKNIPEVTPLAWHEFNLFTNKNRMTEVSHYEAKVVSIETHIENLKKEIITVTNADNTVKHNHYFKTNSDYQNICNLTNEWQTALDLYNQALREIREAKSAVSSAETAEMFDLFSKNKAVSVWSSLENSSAQSEIDDISPAIEKLTNHLKTLQNNEQMLNKKIEVSDSVDLMADLFFDFSFDFTSVFSLMSLGSASSSISDVKNQVEKIGPAIEEALNNHTKLQNDFLNKLS